MLTNQGTNQANQAAGQVIEAMNVATEDSVQEYILQIITANPSITQKEIAVEIQKPLSTVKYYMQQMRKNI